MFSKVLDAIDRQDVPPIRSTARGAGSVVLENDVAGTISIEAVWPDDYRVFEATPQTRKRFERRDLAYGRASVTMRSPS